MSQCYFSPARANNNFLSLSMLSVLVTMLQDLKCAFMSLLQSFKSRNWTALGFSVLAPQAPPTREAKLQKDILIYKAELNLSFLCIQNV